MADHDVFRTSDGVVACDVGEETVLLDTKAGVYFGLNPVGASVWKQITCEKTIAEICAVLSLQYDVARDRLERDIATLLAELAEHRLIQRV